MKLWLLVLLGVLIAIGLSAGGWYIRREVNYNWMYKGLVKETVREMVKSEALK